MSSKTEAMSANISFDFPYNIYVDNEEIKNEVFQEEKVNWKLIDLDEFIDDLLDWIGEQDRNSSDRTLMKQDLFMLNEWEDQFIWSSIETNDYVSPTLHPERFNEICKQVLEANSIH